jgi:predicted anti-sigma-YlaC factor YlaD
MSGNLLREPLYRQVYEMTNHAGEFVTDAEAFVVVPLPTSTTSPTITFTDLLVIVLGENSGFERRWGLTRCAASGW